MKQFLKNQRQFLKLKSFLNLKVSSRFFLKDIFEAGTEIYDQTDKTIENITVLGDENEFFVTYEYMEKKKKNKEFNDDCWLRIWGKKTDDGKYLLERCGGGYQGEMNLEETDITLEDIQ